MTKYSTRTGMVITTNTRHKREVLIPVDKYEEDDNGAFLFAMLLVFLWWIPVVNIVIFISLVGALASKPKRTVRTVYYRRID
jgi:hypothetical protein